MSKQPYNDQTISRYLLGSLPEAETERFDELSFTEDEFAEALKAAEKDLVDAYVQGELTGATLEQFKSYYLASPLRREKVEFAKAFHLMAEKNVGAQTSTGQAEPHEKSMAKRRGTWRFASLGFLPAPRPALQWVAAFAALVLLVAGGWLALENARLRQQVSQTQTRREELGRREQELQKELEGRRSAGEETERELARVREERERLEQELEKQEAQGQQRAAEKRPQQTGGVSIASFVLAPQMRGTAQLETISVPAKTDYVAMQLQLEPGDYPAYLVALLDQADNQTLWRSNKLKARTAGGGKALAVSFRAGLLKPRVYFLRVAGISPSGASEIIGDYPFKVVK